MTLQLLRRTARYVTIRLVGSYPTFSPLPLPERSGGYFLLRYSTLAAELLTPFVSDRKSQCKGMGTERYLRLQETKEKSGFVHAFSKL